MNREVHVRFCERLGVKFPGLLGTSSEIRAPTARPVHLRSLLNLCADKEEWHRSGGQR